MTPEGWLVALLLLAVYLLPTLKGYVRHAPYARRVAIVSVLLGWTVVGWLVALVMAERDPPPEVRRFG